VLVNFLLQLVVGRRKLSSPFKHSALQFFIRAAQSILGPLSSSKVTRAILAKPCALWSRKTVITPAAKKRVPSLRQMEALVRDPPIFSRPSHLVCRDTGFPIFRCEENLAGAPDDLRFSIARSAPGFQLLTRPSVSSVKIT